MNRCSKCNGDAYRNPTPPPQGVEEIILAVHNHGKNGDVIAGSHRPYLSPDKATQAINQLLLEARKDEWDFIAESYDAAHHAGRDEWLKLSKERLDMLTASKEGDEI